MQRALSLEIIASGSSGNAALVVNEATGEGLLVDCGVTKKAFFAGCEEAGFDPRNLAGILITHEHTDHVGKLGVVLRGLRKLDVAPDLYVNGAVVDTSPAVQEAADMVALRPLSLDEQFTVAGIDVVPFRTSHDASFSCGFRFSGGGDAIGFMTDTGTVTPEAAEALAHTRVLAIEANHDLDLLARAPYPRYVQKRIASDQGHLNNGQAAGALEALLSDELEEVVSMHVSEHSNTYRLPKDALFEVVERAGLAGTVRVDTAYQHRSVRL